VEAQAWEEAQAWVEAQAWEDKAQAWQEAQAWEDKAQIWEDMAWEVDPETADKAHGVDMEIMEWEPMDMDPAWEAGGCIALRILITPWVNA